MGFGPQLADLNGDGHIDLLSGSWPGELFFFRGGPKRTFAAPVMLKDKSGEIICIGGGIEKQPDGSILITGHGEFEETEDGKWIVKYPGKTIESTPEQQVMVTGTASAAHAADWDGDGDLDLLVGDIGGSIYLIPNEGAPKNPVWGKHRKLTVGPFLPITVPGGDAAPFVVDWDGDGDPDLLSGAGDGSVQLFLNQGKQRAQPILGPPVALIPPGKVVYGPGAPKEPTRGSRSKICVVDWNGDGRLDLLVGDYATQKPDRPEPTPVEKARHDLLRAELKVIQNRYGQLIDEIGRAKDEETRKKLTEQFEKVNARFTELHQAIPPEYEDHGWVWLFLRKPAEKAS